MRALFKIFAVDASSDDSRLLATQSFGALRPRSQKFWELFKRWRHVIGLKQVFSIAMALSLANSVQHKAIFLQKPQIAGRTPAVLTKTGAMPSNSF